MYGPGGTSIFSMLVIFAILVPIFLLPTIIAIRKQHPHRIGIILVNILGGLFFGLGWVVAVVWCFIEPKASTPIPHSSEELARLHNLKEDGVISQEEFDQQKQRLLGTTPKTE